MVSLEDRCMASIDGPKVGARVVAWRKYCKNRKQKGFSTCRYHLESASLKIDGEVIDLIVGLCLMYCRPEKKRHA